QHLIALVLFHALDQLGDGLWLVAIRGERRLELEGDAALGFCRPLRTMRHEHRQVAVDERMRGNHRLLGYERVRTLRSLGGTREDRVQRCGGREIFRPRLYLAQCWQNAFSPSPLWGGVRGGGNPYR